MSAMRSKRARYVLHKLKVGLRRRCPECEQGRLFERGLKVHETCPYCQVRFSRHAGDSIGSVYINVALAEFTAVLGFMIVHSLTDIPVMHQLLFWVPYLLVFTVVFYPFSRGLWIAIMYLTGAVYVDPDYTREYIAPYYRDYGQRLSLDYDESPEGD